MPEPQICIVCCLLYFVYLVTHLLEEKVHIIVLGYICETRIHGESKTASSLKQLVNRGIPYINAAITVSYTHLTLPTTPYV